MKIILAGYNLDAEVIKELGQKAERQDATPETISAAYARISRDPRPVDELRQVARAEVAKARRSNSTIIFKMGHHSVAEHAVFNFDVIGVSRLALEEVEKFRLCSYTEKSQRYITLGKDYLIPEEIKAAGLDLTFDRLNEEQTKAYFELFELLKEHIDKKYPKLAADPKNQSLLEGWAKEDARYVLSLATLGQLGMTVNARNLELMFRRFASQPLAEVKKIGRELHKQVERIAPSIILFHQANDLDAKTYPELAELARSWQPAAPPVSTPELITADVRLVTSSPDGDDLTAAALLFAGRSGDWAACLDRAKRLSRKQKTELFQTACRHLEFYDSVLREYELPELTFELMISASAFAQLKRHRMATLLCQDYDPKLGVRVPPAIAEIGREKRFLEITEKAAEVFAKVQAKEPAAAAYALTNAHRKRVLLKVNARELYHLSRLREDVHAQWDIRQLSAQMSDLARQALPLTCNLLGGKDRYPEVYQKIFGRSPKIKPEALFLE